MPEVHLRLNFPISISIIVAILGLCPMLAEAQQDFGQVNPYAAGAAQQYGNPDQMPPDVNHSPYQSQVAPAGQFGQQYPPGGGYPAPQRYPGGGQNYAPQQQATQAVMQQKVSPQTAAQIYQWFLKYDEIRRRAQMNPIEKQQADALLAKGLGLFMPGQDKLAARQLLSGLVLRYQTAAQALRSLPVLNETKQLHEAYFKYFDSAMQLFSDYLKVQDNVFAVDNTGQSIAKQLIQRKAMLEGIEHYCKDLDAQMRNAYGVPAYQY